MIKTYPRTTIARGPFNQYDYLILMFVYIYVGSICNSLEKLYSLFSIYPYTMFKNNSTVARLQN